MSQNLTSLRYKCQFLINILSQNTQVKRHLFLSRKLFSEFYGNLLNLIGQQHFTLDFYWLFNCPICSVRFLIQAASNRTHVKLDSSDASCISQILIWLLSTNQIL